MFLHEFKYSLLRSIRSKRELFWVLIFPLALGTMFHIAFSNIISNTETFHSIPIAVVSDNSKEADTFQQIVKEIDIESSTEESLFDISYVSKDEANILLQESKISGIITFDEKLRLTVSPVQSSSTLLLQQSILESFVEQYNQDFTAMTDIISEHPDQLEQITSVLHDSTNNYFKEISLTSGNMDYTAEYFFNLIAMACMYTSFAGLRVATKNQANLSAIGARKKISPVNRLISFISEYLSCTLIQFLCLGINLLYLIFVLKVDFGVCYGLVVFTTLLGTMFGVSFGLLIGSIGHISEGLKIGILVCLSMLCSFLSGLMSSNMRLTIENTAPIINKINPTALLSDGFYALSIYDTYSRYSKNMVTLFAITMICLCMGYFFIRREKYASL